MMPAVFYGKKQKSTPISLAQKDFIKAWKRAGESSVITLSRKEGDLEALIQDVDRDPITSAPRHADFYVFERGQKIQVSVPIEFKGVAPAVKDLGGILVKVLHQLKVEAEPKNLPHEINVDIGPLINFESQILAKDIILPAGVALIEKQNEVIASVKQFVEEKEEIAPVDLSAIEVEKKGKVLEEGKEGAEAPTSQKETPIDSKENKAKAERPERKEKK